ncbi:MAG: hypothetical protein ACOC1T_03660, partial [Halorhodospira sp.]
MELFSVFGRVGIEGVRHVEQSLSRVDDRASRADLDAEGNVSIDGTREVRSRLGDLERQSNEDYDVNGQVRVSGIRGVVRRLGELRESMGDLSRRAERLGGRLSRALSKPAATGAATASGAIGGLTTQQAEAGKETQVMAERLGMGTDAMQELAYAGQRFGAEKDAVVDGLKELQLRASEFASTGEGPAKDMFESLGLSQSEVARLSKDTEALFSRVQKEIAGVQNQAEKQRMADELFGGQGGEQLVTMLSAAQSEIQGLRSEANQVGAVVPEGQLDTLRGMSNSLQRLRGTLSGAAATIASEATPAFKEMVEAFREYVTANEEAMGEAASGFFQWIKDTGAPLLKTFLETVGGLAKAFAALPAPVQKLVGVAAGLAAVLGPILLVFTSLATPVKVAVGLFSSLGPAIAGAATAMAPLLAAATPFIAIAAAIAAAVAAAIVVFKNWDTIIEALGNAWKGLTEQIRTAVESMVGAIGDLWEAIKDLPGKAAEAFVELRDRAWGVVTDWINDMRDAIADFAMWLPNKIKEGADAAVGAFKGMYDAVIGNSIVPDMVEDVGKNMVR